MPGRRKRPRRTKNRNQFGRESGTNAIVPSLLVWSFGFILGSVVSAADLYGTAENRPSCEIREATWRNKHRRGPSESFKMTMLKRLVTALIRCAYACFKARTGPRTLDTSRLDDPIIKHDPCAVIRLNLN
jgi:hypothetical protein